MRAIVTQQLDTDEGTSFSACLFAVFCDKEREAYVDCGGITLAVNQGKQCYGYCVSNKGKGWLDMLCDSWARQKSTSKKKGSGPLPPTSTTSSMFFALTKISTSIMSGFLPAKYSEEVTDDQEAKEIITGSIRWRLIEGEAGIDQGMLMVAKGEAEARSFCTGDSFRLVGPNVISLPTCQVDVSGRWQGAYARPLSKGTRAAVTVSLNLRKESGSLRGELTTPDGTFNIVEGFQSGSNINLQAERTVAGTRGKIILHGKLTKGDMVFGGSEQSPGGAVTYGLTGFVRRLYIADSALLPAVLNQPYSFPLTAFSPENQAITFRVAGGQLPRGISLDGQSGTLSGTPTELGIFNIRVVADDAAGNVFEQPLTLTVKKLVITRLLPDAFLGQSYSATLKVAGGQPPYRFSGFPPKGLTLDPKTGEVSGTPSSTRSNTSYLTVRDSQNNSESQNVSLEVRGTTILTSHFLPEATKGSPYHTQFQVVGNSLPTKWSIVGEGDINSIGLTLNLQTGELSGTPTKPGAFLLSVLAKTTSVDQQYRNFALTIK